MESMVLAAEKREQLGTRVTRKIRNDGRIPAIIYGHKETPEAVSVCAEEMERAVRHHSRTFILDLGGNKQQVMVKELQWDHLGADILHIDFQRVSADERVEVPIPLEFRGEIAPGTGGMFEHPMQALMVECPALSQPESIRVEIGGMQIGDSILVQDLKLPEGVRPLDPPETVVAQVIQAAGEVVEDEDAEAVAEPEKIGGKPDEDSEDE